MKSLVFAILPATLACANPFPAIYNSEPGDAKPMPAGEALGKLRLPKGFQATLFASEPDVQNPIAGTWDSKGRLWVAENYTYAERGKRFDLSLNDQVIILEDKDNDGVAETRKVFTDQVKMLTSLELAADGVYLMCPPQLLFIPDADHDDVPDGAPQVILDGFDVAQENYDNFANGLRFGPDGWLYGRCGHSCPAKIGAPGTPDGQRVPMAGGIWRYNPGKKITEVLCTGTNNPWGHDWDGNGEMFFSDSIIGHVGHMIPGAHFKVPDGEDPNPFVYERMDTIADHQHSNTTGGGDSHAGGMIYQAAQWPEQYRGKFMMLNLHGRRVNVERLEQQDYGYVAKHESDIIFSDDPWFRGIDLTTGPDGSVFILDRSDTGDFHEHSGVHRESGRIYKVSYGKPEKPELTLLDDLSPDGVGKIIRHPNAWYHRRLNILFLGKPIPEDVATRLKEIADADESSPLRLRAYFLLQSHGMLSMDDISKLVRSEDKYLQFFGIRCVVDGLPIDRADGTMIVKSSDIAERSSILIVIAASKPGAFARLALASAMQRLPSSERREAVIPLAIDQISAKDPTLMKMIWIGTANDHGEELKNIISLAYFTNTPELLRWSARYMASRSKEYPEPFTKSLDSIYSSEKKMHLLRGVADGMAGVTSAPKPDSWGSFAYSIKDPEATPLVQRLSIVFGSDSTIEHLKKIVLDSRADMTKRQSALDILIETRVVGVGELCAIVIAIPKLNGNALRGLALSDDIATAKLILGNYSKFLPADRPVLFKIMAARADWVALLRDQIEAGRIPKSDIPESIIIPNKPSEKSEN
jgi:putative membrane-bound dehydrogenase-like protein